MKRFFILTIFSCALPALPAQEKSAAPALIEISRQTVEARVFLEEQKRAFEREKLEILAEISALEELEAQIKAAIETAKDSAAKRRETAKDFLDSVEASRKILDALSAQLDAAAGGLVKEIRLNPAFKNSCGDVAEGLSKAFENPSLSAAEKLREIFRAYDELLRRDMKLYEGPALTSIGLAFPVEGMDLKSVTIKDGEEK